MHLTWRLKKNVTKIRRMDALEAFKKAAERAQKFGLRILHFSILSNHIHMIAEANSNETLATGMRSFGSSFGKNLRKLSGGTGPVFDGRFHMRPLTTPSEMKNALAYVLQNFAKHEDLIHHYDRYSSAPYFKNWKELFGHKRGPLLEDEESSPSLPKFLSSPKSWLASVGWMQAKTAAPRSSESP